MTDVINFIKDHLIIMLTIIGLIVLFIYIICAVLLNKLNKALYGKTTWMAWIPPFNIYLLGKLTIHKVFGWLLLIASLAGTTVKIEINDVSKSYALLPENIQEPYMIIISAIIVILYIVAYIKYKAYIRKNGSLDTYDIKNFSNLNRPFIEKKPIITSNSNQENEVNQLPINDINVSQVKLQDVNGMHTDNIEDHNKTINTDNNQNP